ncbi:DUF6602 domain-containing protein [Sporocytophaga myxococcoides]|uniref:DUF6602 domain-containing protein n=1 Tax=Sporocytophaga myxococcoides TaxID=153721 RepID=UPI00041E9C70|nr:DUF6602 domain-containing protein [Sporocytophaga myxococcoides]
MQQKFDINAFLKHLAYELINNFSFAGQATTPGLVGSAREKITRQKLETLLPPMVGVGSGCVIDSFGGTSKQMDIILFEKHLCPVFSINDNPETTYYPCEGVIAVGEIKSTLNNSELEDIFRKTESVKSLRRFAIPSKGVLVPDETVSFRHYGNTGAFECTKEEEFNQDKKRTDQIFYFAFCGELGVHPQTLINKFIELSKIYPKQNLINLISILNHGLLLYMNRAKGQIRYWYGDDADSIYITPKRDNNFQFLINRLNEVVRGYRTTETKAFSKYTAISEGPIFLNGTFGNL